MVTWTLMKHNLSRYGALGILQQYIVAPSDPRNFDLSVDRAFCEIQRHLPFVSRRIQRLIGGHLRPLAAFCPASAVRERSSRGASSTTAVCASLAHTGTATLDRPASGNGDAMRIAAVGRCARRRRRDPTSQTDRKRRRRAGSSNPTSLPGPDAAPTSRRHPSKTTPFRRINPPSDHGIRAREFLSPALRHRSHRLVAQDTAAACGAWRGPSRRWRTGVVRSADDRPPADGAGPGVARSDWDSAERRIRAAVLSGPVAPQRLHRTTASRSRPSADVGASRIRLRASIAPAGGVCSVQLCRAPVEADGSNACGRD